MKKKNWIFNIIIGLSLFGIIFVIVINSIPKSKKQTIMLLGDYYFKNLEDTKKVFTINTSFINNNFQSNDLLRLINNNAIKLEQDKTYKVQDLIARSKEIIISIGMNDIVSCFSYDKYLNKYHYDENNVNLTLSILYGNLNAIIEDIKLINEDSKITLLSYYIPYNYDSMMKEIFNTANKNMQTLLQEYQSNYLDVTSLGASTYIKSNENYQLNEKGQNYLNELIITYLSSQ